MRFSTSLALVAAAIVPAALAQSVTIDPATLTQCATSTLTYEGSTGPYYVAVLPASDPCTEDAIAEFYDVTGNSVDYYVNQPAGTQVQIYVLDVNGEETWGEIETVGNGDGSCLPGASTSSSDSATSTSSTTTSSSSAAPSAYVPPQAATTSRAPTYSSPNTGGSDSTNNSDNTDDTPANAADDTTGGASTVTASASLLVGAIIAAAALL